MPETYDNWVKLVEAVVKQEQVRQLFHDHSRTPSSCSESSDLASTSYLGSPLHEVAVDFLRSPEYWEQNYEAFVELREGITPKLVLVSNLIPSFDIKGMRVAYLEVLGRGTFGCVYAVVTDNGSRLVVKRLNRGLVSELEFRTNMEMVGNVRHENVVCLRGYHSSEDERFLLYDYYGRGSMHSLLHDGNHANVDWETRMRIAIGAARGLAEIHAQYSVELVHGNIKASNVLLNSERYGCIADLGLRSMIQTVSMSDAWCYAPEVAATAKVSQASDVYSFGILLLELVTRKSPVKAFGSREAVDLVKLVTSVKSKRWAQKVFDADLVKHPILKQHMVKLLRIGMSCVEKSPKRRPKMSFVVQMLEDACLMSTAIPSLPKPKFVLFEDGNLGFTVEDILSAHTEVLGRGTLWDSYKAILENGNTYVVKHLKDANVKCDKFRQHIEIIGRVRHEGVTALRAHFFTDLGNCFVYDYYNQESLSALQNGAERRPLDWESRLKIAVGAARGIAHIHRQDGGKLVHGNIKALTIFITGQQCGLVCDTGLAKLSGGLTPTYCAPEVTEPMKVSQASDVYSFGVVLLRLLSGKLSQITMHDGEVSSLVDIFRLALREGWYSELIDHELWVHGKDNEAIVLVLHKVMDCVATLPERRPKMAEVTRLLEDISGIDSDDQPPISSRLEYLLDALLPTLTP